MSLFENDGPEYPTLPLPAFKTTKFSRARFRETVIPPPRKKQHSNKSSISQKLKEYYVQRSWSKDIAEETFINGKYLEEFIIQNSLSYIIVKVYPRKKMSLFIKNPDRVQLWKEVDDPKEEKLILESISIEEIPRFMNDCILEYPWVLVYDYHCFVQLQKYSSDNEDVPPIFSNFVLLEPTYSLFFYLSGKRCFDHGAEGCNGISEEEFKSEYESKLSLESSGPLCLDISPITARATFVLQFYRNPSSTSIRKKTWRPYLNEILSSNDLWEKLCRNIRHPIHLSRGNEAEITNFMVDGPNLKQRLESRLARRHISVYDMEDFLASRSVTVEVFKIIVKLESDEGHSMNREEAHKKKYITVFWQYNTFYTCMTLKKYAYQYKPFGNSLLQNRIELYRVGSRVNLDRYILEVAYIMSRKFCKQIFIKHTDMIDYKESVFLSNWNYYMEKYYPPVVETSNSARSESNVEINNSAHDWSNFDWSNSVYGMSSHTNSIGELGDEESVHNPEDGDSSEEHESRMKTRYCNTKPGSCDGKTVKLAEKKSDKGLHIAMSKGINVPSTSTSGIATGNRLFGENVPSTSTSGLATSNRLFEENAPTTSKAFATNDEMLMQRSLPRISNDALNPGVRKGTKKASRNSLSHILKSDVFSHVFKSKSNSERIQEEESDSPDQISVASIFYDGQRKVIYEAHPFLNVKKTDLSSLKEEGKTLYISRPLKSKTVLSRKDLLKHPNHDHSDKMKELLKLLKKGIGRTWTPRLY